MRACEFRELIKKEISINRVIKIVKEIAEEVNQPLYLVGGFLRDAFLKRENLDLDFLVGDRALAISRRAAERFRAKLIIMDKEHIVNYRVVKKGLSMDFADIFNDKGSRKSANKDGKGNKGVSAIVKVKL